ncbi:MAG: 5-formyltetrahydrofolate cyclo-ligase [Rhodospirillales bacterium]|nr:5-formyltetrahydrofolate cyclo-ligase [Rhodospirillales bacterium]
MSEPATRKDHERKSASARRGELHAAHPDGGIRLAAHVRDKAETLGLAGVPKTASVFWSMGNEIDTGPLLKILHTMGHRTALPVVAKKAAPLIFRLWAPGDALADGGFGTSIPAADAEEVTPDVLFVPLLAFDNDGFRLGYGGGFYDRTLEMLRAGSDDVIAIGVAFSGQRVDTVPRGPHDQPLDWIATELGVSRFEPEGAS